jgi:DNA-binding HxlR family transcriptional regulator
VVGRGMRHLVDHQAGHRPVAAMTEADANTHRFTADSVERAMTVIGDRWTFLILREAFFGAGRFSQLARNLGITRNLLARRLEILVEAGVLDRTIYNHRADWHEYRLTDRGRDLYDIVLAVIRWGDQHLGGPEGPPLLLRHSAYRISWQAGQLCAKRLDTPPESARQQPAS